MVNSVLSGLPTGKYAPDMDAYLAGFFDGEGWIMFVLRNRKNDWVPRIRVGAINTVKYPIDLFVKFYGGTTWSTTLPSGKTAWRWQAEGKIAYWALSRMLPWLTVRRKTTAAALDALLCLPSRKGVRMSRRQQGAVAKAYYRFHGKLIPLSRYPSGRAR